MRVLILAATTQKAQIASKLLESDLISTIPLSTGCKKLVSNAHALIIYFENKDDLKSMQKLINIYMGVPIRFYYGSFNYEDFEKFYKWEDAQTLIEDILKVQAEVSKSSEEVYKLLLESSKISEIKLKFQTLKIEAKGTLTEKNELKQRIAEINQEEKAEIDQIKWQTEEELGEEEDAAMKKSFTVAEMLEPFDENERDLLEEECVAFFKSKKGASNKTTDVQVTKKKFSSWWEEGKLDHFENIKYYLIKRISELVTETAKDKIPNISEKKVHTDRFESYSKKREDVESRILKEHYESNFELTFPRVVKEKTTKKGGKEPTTAGPPVEKVAEIRPNTLIDLELTFFPNLNDDTINYLQNLHMFKERRSWFSIGMRPKAKDLKSVIEDLNRMEYLKTIAEEMNPSITLDGKRVRIGFESASMDPFAEKLSKQAEDLQKLAHQLDSKGGDLTPCILTGQILFDRKLDQMLDSSAPLISEIMQGMSFTGSLKFHKNQFRSIFKGVHGEGKFDGNIATADKTEGDKEEDKEGDKEEHHDHIHHSDEEDHSHHDHSEKKSESEDDSNDYGQDDDDENSEDSGSDSFGTQDEGEDKKDEKDEGMSLINIFSFLLPAFLFKWDAKINISPDIAEIISYCKKNQHESFMLQSFKGIAKTISNVDIGELLHGHGEAKDKGSRQELMNYLVKEIGNELEFSWMTSMFFMNGTLKTEDLGKALQLLSLSKLI